MVWTARHTRWTVRALLLASCAGVWLSAASVHFKLLLGVVVAGVAIFQLMAWWSEGNAGRRKIFFITVLFAPVTLLASEVLLAWSDWMQSKLTAPLRLSTADTRQGMLIRSKTCSYGLIPSRRYPLWEGEVAIDRNGFRSLYDVQAEKAPGSVRVMLMGGSTAFGWGVPDGQDLGACLRALLDGRQGRRFEVINAAVPYYASFQEFNQYVHVLWAYRPDVLIVLDGRNDAADAVEKGGLWQSVEEGGIGPSPFWDPAQQVASLGGESYIEHVLMLSALYRRLHNVVQPPESQPAQEGEPFRPVVHPGPIDRRFIEQFVRYHRLLAEAAARDGVGRCIFALQPILHLGKPLCASEQAMATQLKELGRGLQQVWPELQGAALAVQSDGAITIDLTDVFAECAFEAYLDGCHYTPEATRVLARRLAEQLLRSAATLPSESQAGGTSKPD